MDIRHTPLADVGAPPTSDDAFPDRVQGYTFLQTLYRSPITLVVRGRAEVDGAEVVIKLPAPQAEGEQARLRYRSEFETLRALHEQAGAVGGEPRIVRARELVARGTGYALVLESIADREPLSKRSGSRLSVEQALCVGVGICEALADVHAAGVVHKDINPNNVLVSPSFDRVTLIDFGISSTIGGYEQSFSSVKVLQGTLSHIAPEQTGRMNRALDYRADYYALGVTLYQLLSGELPFRAEDAMDFVHAHIAQRATPVQQREPSVPAPVSAIVEKLMAKAPDDRYQGPRALRQDLLRCLTELREKGVVAPFPLGTGDRSPRLVIPQKLYGREREVGMVLAQFERAAEGENAWLLVSGASGVGKSMLVHETHRPITERRGYFASGKFDQFKRSTPLHALIEAFSSLLRQQLTEDETTVDRLRQRLRTALGPNAKLIADVIPELHDLLPGLPPLAEVPAAEAQNRFRMAFLNFIQALAQRRHPLVLFLDDLQWADPSTLALLQQLGRQDPDPDRALFFIGAYRSNEVDAAHPLALMLADLAQARFTPETIVLGALSHDDTEALVSDTLGSGPTAAQLAAIVFQKTQGNPFFIAQLLTTLYKDKLLALDVTTGVWSFSAARVLSVESTENVAEMVLQRLRKLPPPAQRALALASCIGARFDLHTLAEVAQTDSEELMLLLGTAAAEGFVTGVASDTGAEHAATRSYRFIHDRVQQAAHELTGDDRPQIAHTIASALLKQNGATGGEHLFEVLAHLAVAEAVLVQQDERTQYAELCLQGGLRAREATAYVATAQYLALALRLLPNDPWQGHFQVAFAATQALAECEFLLGNRERSLALFDDALKHARSLPERTNIQTQVSTLSTHQQRADDAIAISLKSLSSYGQRWKRKTSTLHVILTLLGLKRTIARTDLDTIRNAGSIDDPDKLAHLRALMALTPALYVAGETKLYAVAIMTGVQMAMRFGNTPDTALTYIAVGMLLGVAFGDFEQGERFSKLGLELFKRFPHGDLETRGNMMHGGLTVHWRRPMREALPFLRRGYELGLESGSWLYGGYSLFLGTWVRFHAGEPLSEVVTACDAADVFLRRSQNEGTRVGTLAVRGLCMSLSDPTWTEADVVPAEYADAALLARTVTQTGRHSVAIARLMSAVVFGDREASLSAAQLSHETHQGSFALMNFAMHTILCALVHCRYYASYGAARRLRHRVFMRQAQKKLRTWARNAPANFEDKRLLVAGAWAAARGRHGEAIELFEQAAESARAAGSTQFQALAWESAAQSALALGKRSFARVYLLDARRSYERWGALRKVAKLDAAQVELLRELHVARSPSPVSQANTQTYLPVTVAGTRTETGDAIDLATVVKASQVLSGEVVLDNLVTKLLQMVIRNAGATQGALLFEREGAFHVSAYGQVSGAEVAVEMAENTAFDGRVATSVVAYVARTKRTVVLANAAEDAMFGGDAQLKAGAARSLLCLPVIRQGKISTIVYLENPLVSDAFSRDRVAPLTMLAAQIGISIENATLYGDLEAKVAERTRELGAANHNIEQLLDHMRQAIVAFGPDGCIVGRASKEALHVFGTGLRAGGRILDVVFAGVPTHDIGRATFSEFLEVAFQIEADSWDELAELLPNEVVAFPGTPEERVLLCEFRPIVESGAISRIMLLATDDTERRRLTREARARELVHQREMTLMRKLLTGGGHLFVAFMRATEERLGRFHSLLNAAIEGCDRATVEELFQHVHTMKGEARAYELSDLADVFARMEDRLDILRSRMDDSGLGADALSSLADPRASSSFYDELTRGCAEAHGAIAQFRRLLIQASPIGEAVLDQIPVSQLDVRALQGAAAGVTSDDPRVAQLVALASRLASRPFGESTARLLEGVPTWASSLGKRAQLSVEGKDVAIPPSLAEVLPGALTHIVRNALAHGIESAEKRAIAGKSEVGNVTLHAQPGERGPEIHIRDDGQGLDVQRLREKGQALGMVVADGHEWELIFVDGLSTAQAVNDIAGRGVGMAAVRAELLRAGYRVEVCSTAGEGTEIVLRPMAPTERVSAGQDVASTGHIGPTARKAVL